MPGPRPRTPEPSSRLLNLVRGQFPAISDLELAFVARVAARGHAAHVATLLDAGPPSGARARAAYEKAKRRAAELDLAWSQISTLLALTDLAEDASPEDSVPAQRDVARVARMLFDPDCITGGTCLADVLPPRAHLPDRLPELIRSFFPSTPPQVCCRTRASAAGAPLSIQ